MSNPDKKGKKSSLAFRAVATYMWPFTGGEWYKYRGLKTEFMAAVKGTGRFIKHVTIAGAALAAHQVIQPTTGMLFPSAEDYLEEQGLDPALAKELSNNEIHIRGRGLLGTLHSTMDFPTLPGWIMGRYVTQDPYNAFAIRGLRIGGFSTYDLLGQCNVTMLDESATAAQMISVLSGIPEEELEYIPVTDKEMQITVAFHEFAHCDDRNLAHEQPFKESDADARGITLAAQALDNEEIRRTFLYARATRGVSNSHDSALYVDADMRGETLPTVAEMAQPTDDAFALADMYIRNHELSGPAYLQKAIALQNVINQHGDLLTDYAKRRAELYIEAVQYFVPSAIEKIEAGRARPAMPSAAPQPNNF